MTLLAGAYYIADRGYFSFSLLDHINTRKAFYVVRPFRHVKFRVKKSMPVDKNTGLRCDQLVKMTGRKGRDKYLEPIRRIKYRDAEVDKSLVFFTNDFSLPALVIAALYKQRWQVELFFKWIK